jgi:hypothetical protein
MEGYVVKNEVDAVIFVLQVVKMASHVVKVKIW